MYAVVGCRDCSALWVVEGRPDTTRCRRCGSRHPYDRLRQFVTVEDPDRAREVRASMLAARGDETEAFAEVDPFADLEDRADEAVVDDEELLRSAGVDPEAAAAAGDRATEGAGGGRSRPERVRAALRSLEAPDREAVVDHAADRGVPPEATREIIDRLVRRGELIEDDGLRLV